MLRIDKWHTTAKELIGTLPAMVAKADRRD
jgi:hypothetical protein